jgi:hypothetical protein
MFRNVIYDERGYTFMINLLLRTWLRNNPRIAPRRGRESDSCMQGYLFRFVYTCVANQIIQYCFLIDEIEEYYLYTVCVYQ